VGLWDDRGNYSAATNVFPSAGGSGAGGAILKGDIWTISAVGTLGGVAVREILRALSDAPVQVVGSWSIAEGNLGYTPYNSSNPAGYTSNLGTVGLSGGTTGMTFLCSITGSGVTMAGVLAIANGGTSSCCYTRRSRIWNRICSRLYTGGNRTSITIRSWSSPYLEDVRND
jgi:hypothetical protein